MVQTGHYESALQQETRLSEATGPKVALAEAPNSPVERSLMSTQQDDVVMARSMANRTERNIRWLFVSVAAAVIGTTVFTYYFGNRELVIRNLAVAHRSVIAESGHLLSAMTDAETGVRGFIITGDEPYLLPCEYVRARMPEILDYLQKTRVSALEPETLNAIQNLSETKLAEFEQTIATRREHGFDAAAALMNNGVGKRTMRQLWEQISRLQDQQESALREEAANADQAAQARTMAFTLGGLANLLFIAWAYVRIAREIRAREEALLETTRERTEVRRQKDLLAVTLASIGDCVIVTDKAGIITFMNGVAEKLTGWTFNEARLRPIADVFKIVNEFTHEPAENPIDQVIATGAIVGLANHTLLIRKDGSKVPIDDSGAPIRDADGTMRGVVLVFRDFSEHKEQQRKLKEAKEAAETANKAKDQFLAMLSHELRTPLTPVLATLNLWEASDELSPALQADAQMLRRSVELEARIIDDLLDLTRIARGMLSFSAEDTDLHELIGHLVGMCHSEFRSKELEVSVRLNAEMHHVYTDAGRLQQVLWNVLRNAAKFTECRGNITLATSNDENRNIVISVVDNGIGMAAETLSRLFMPFEQGEQLISRRYGGLGLGMAISSALVELLGGTLTAFSEGLGKGSTFTITFPAKSAEQVKPKPTELTRKSRTGLGVRILLIEDHSDTSRALERLLQRQGYEVMTADSVASGLEAMRDEKFNLLVCDIGLPDGTGFQLIEEVRKHWRTPALALSGFGTEEDVAKSRLAGFEGHLTKPVNFQKLEAAIWQLTSKGETYRRASRESEA
jgi:PAS domain S-box-containing protein